MQLNSYPADQGSVGPSGGMAGTMRSDKATWSKAGGDVGDLRDNADKSLTTLSDAQVGLSDQLGCLTAAAQQGVYESWVRRVEDIKTLCDGLAGILKKAGNDQLRTDQAIQAEIEKLNSAKATDAVDSGKGR
ncbi:hypothetical protein PV682_30140 [Streptomyces niveiscabiei]|uniref:hypothetical protein n=1 Tax=Streptomyces niveiscabiei TaxID=164115 RepID=UPI0029AC221A|nr:hypothetical protein [Streptomyces niveiscabiei]MDX3385692.1 hypothetical protein [Streptomyces niveiscabiei]